jgi:hypothetical protein
MRKGEGYEIKTSVKKIGKTKRCVNNCEKSGCNAEHISFRREKSHLLNVFQSYAKAHTGFNYVRSCLIEVVPLLLKKQ